MFPSTTVNGVLHAYAEQYLFDHVTPSSRNDFSSSPFFHFSPTIDHGDNNAFLPHDPFDGDFLLHPLLIANASKATEAAINNITTSTKLPTHDISLMGSAQNLFPNKKNSSLGLGRKRGGCKKDRHSKIFTAQGPRDRRMRLSLEIARKFFNLQDMLGFDKASKTVDWLLTMSKAAIKQLARDLARAKGCSSVGGGAMSVSSASEGEVMSGIGESTNNVDESKEKSAAEATPKAKRSRQTRKATFNPLSKKWRASARERARERTMKKKFLSHPNIHDPPQLTSLSPHETGEESGSHSSHDKKSSSELLLEVEEPSSHSLEHQCSIQDVIDESLPVTCRPGNSIFEYHQQITTSLGVNSNDLISFQNNDMINNFFPENWDMDSSTSTRTHSRYCAIPYEHLSTGNLQERIGNPLFRMSTGNHSQSQFMDYQYCAKPWEGYNN